jgi:hypothetical protein
MKENKIAITRTGREKRLKDGKAIFALLSTLPLLHIPNKYRIHIGCGFELGTMPVPGIYVT